jgi:chloride channel protein, CIC family
MADAAETPPLASPEERKQFLLLLVLAAVVGVVVSFAAWCFLQGVHELTQAVYDDLPRALGYDHGAPRWWPLPACFIAGVVTAFAIVRLPGRGGHVPARGLAVSPTQPIELPGVILAAVATLSLGIVLGPEAPLIALGGGLAALALQLVRRDAPEQVMTVMVAAGAFAAISFIFNSPLIAAMILIEATGIGGPRLPLVLVPGLLAAGVGSLVAIGMGSWTGVSTSDFALGPVSLPEFVRPAFTDFVWAIPFAVAVAVGVLVVIRAARELLRVVESREFVAVPLAGLAVAGLAIAFSYAADKSVNAMLFSGESALPGLVSDASAWSVGALALLLAFKGLGWAISLAAFRGGPIFPSLFLGSAAGLMASHLPGFAETPAVAVGMGAAVVAALGLPLAAVILAVLLTSGTGAGATPVIIVGVVTAYLVTRMLPLPPAGEPAPAGAPESEAQAVVPPAVAST